MSEAWNVEDQLRDRRRRMKATTFDERLAWLRSALDLARESGALQRERHRRLREAGAEAATFGRIRDLCMAFGDVERTHLQGRPLFRVGRRRFAIFNGGFAPARLRWAESGCSLHFLGDPAEVDALHADPRFTASPHHGDHGWFALGLDGELNWDEIAELLESAHAQVARPKER